MFRRVIAGVAAISLIGALALPATPAGAASGDTVTGSPFLSHTYAGSSSYDYNPSIIQSGSTQKVWWCGGGANPYHSGYVADNIYYAARNASTGAFTQSPISVFNEGTAGAWDDNLDCNPSVIGGNFSPFGDGVHYTLAMYYVAVSFTYSVNQIGVAFSNDGMTWRRWGSPAISRSNPGGSCYGLGSPSTYNIDGVGNIRIFYEDICNGGFTLLSATTTDGVHFSASDSVNQSNLGYCNSTAQGGVPTDANFAFEPTNGDWYATMDLGCSNGQRAAERGTIGFKIFKMHAGATDSLANGTWQTLQTVDTNATGYEINSWPAPVRDQFGNITLPDVSVWYSVSNPRPPANTTVAQAQASAGSSFWDISYSTLITNQGNETTLVRYQGSTHDVTTGYVNTSAFPVNEGSLGLLYESPRPSTVALYNCQVANTYDYFVSQDMLCEGQRIIGIEGYAPTTSGPNEYPLYRCVVPNSGHFVSHDPNCEGKTTESLLGYALAS